MCALKMNIERNEIFMEEYGEEILKIHNVDEIMKAYNEKKSEIIGKRLYIDTSEFKAIMEKYNIKVTKRKDYDDLIYAILDSEKNYSNTVKSLKMELGIELGGLPASKNKDSIDMLNRMQKKLDDVVEDKNYLKKLISEQVQQFEKNQNSIVYSFVLDTGASINV